MTSPTPESYNNPSISPVSVPWVPGAPPKPDSSGNETETNDEMTNNEVDTVFVFQLLFLVLMLCLI